MINTFGEDVSIRIGYAPGAYDLFHVGHLNLLRHAKGRCDFLIAGVVSDDMLELTKGRRPVIPLEERLAIVSHISYVDRAVAEVVPDKLEPWESVRFNVLFKGDDWRGTAKGEKLERAFAASTARARHRGSADGAHDRTGHSPTSWLSGPARRVRR